MKNTFWNQLLCGADDFWPIGMHVTPEPDGENGGGAVDNPTPPLPSSPGNQSPANTSDEPLGESGKRALAAIRGERDEINRQLAEAKAQIERMKDYLPPEDYRKLLQEQEDARKKARERELELQQQKSETEEQFQSRLIEAQKERDVERKAKEDAEASAAQERLQRFEFAKRTNLSSAFYANGGRDGQDEEGTTYFDLFMKARGDERTKYDPETNQTYVIDKDGNTVNGEDNKPLSIAAWMKQLADTNPIIGGLFDPRGGSGSGGLQGARGITPVPIADIAAQRAKRATTLLQEVDWSKS